MCIGIPMRVVESNALWSWCDDGGERVKVDMQLVGLQPPGTWLLVFLGAARDVMEELQAKQVRDALAAMQAVLDGQPVDRYFADLIEREPQLPEHLRG